MYDEARKREREERQKERANYSPEYKFPVMAWVTELVKNRLYIGPRPRTEEQTGYLVHNLRVSIFVSILPNTTQLYYADYMKDILLPCQGLDDDRMFPPILRYPFDESKHKKKGNTKTEQLDNKAFFYVDFAKSIVKVLHTRRQRDTIYIHCADGNMEEVFIGFTVWLLLGEGDVPSDPVKWIAENNERLLDDDADNKELLMAIWKKANELKKAHAMFFGPPKGGKDTRKRQKTQEGQQQDK